VNVVGKRIRDPHSKWQSHSIVEINEKIRVSNEMIGPDTLHIAELVIGLCDSKVDLNQPAGQLA